jgi:hypothetical protein
MCPATLRRKANGLKPLQLDVALGTWRRIKVAAATSSPPLTQVAYLRAILAKCEPVMAPEPGEAPPTSEA